jgi:hypothetical protein
MWSSSERPRRGFCIPPSRAIFETSSSSTARILSAHHQRITLSLDSYRPEFQPVVTDAAEATEGELNVIAEIVAVMDP